jgi:mannose-6-phosphate isomerase-like protein (cupin superfamily)
MVPRTRIRIPFEEGLTRIPGPDGERFATVFRHGTLEVEVYAPRGSDPQTPHTRDETYVVIRGQGTYRCDGAAETFGPGDFLFAPAGAVHRFEDFSQDLVVWVMFYGPEGGERPGAPGTDPGSAGRIAP